MMMVMQVRGGLKTCGNAVQLTIFRPCSCDGINGIVLRFVIMIILYTVLF